MTLPLRPRRGGFLRPFRCGEFIRDYLFGKGPHGSIRIDPKTGAPQATIFRQYKLALMRAISLDWASRKEERNARKENRYIDPEKIEGLALDYFSHLPYKPLACRYNSFKTYFSDLKSLNWVELTGREEPSEFQDNYSDGQPRKYFRLTQAGKEADDDAWRNPHRALYGK